MKFNYHRLIKQKMDKQRTLENYLNRRALSSLKSAKSASGYSIATTAAYVQKFASQESWRTDFFDSKRECQRELKRIKDKLVDEETAIIRYLENHENSLESLMVEEFQRFKTEIQRMMDTWFEDNRRQIRDTLRAQGVAELRHIEQIRLSLNHIKRRIEEYEKDLQTEQYKKGIAAIVTNDFQTQGYALVVEIAKALGRYQDKVCLKIDPIRYNRLRDQITNLILYGKERDGEFTKQHIIRTLPEMGYSFNQCAAPNPREHSLPHNTSMSQPPPVQYVYRDQQGPPSNNFSSQALPNHDSRVRSNRIFDGAQKSTARSRSLHRNRDILQSS